MGKPLTLLAVGLLALPTAAAAEPWRDEPAVAALFRSAVSNELIARMLREVVVRQITRRVIKELNLDPAEGPIRTTLVFSQVSGLITARYIIKVEPLASLPSEVVVGMVGPTIQRYLTGDLPFEQRG